MIFDRFLASSEVMQVLAECAFVQAMLDFESALARAQADAGAIPSAAGAAIAAACDAGGFDVDAIVAEGSRVGTVAIPLVKALTAAVAKVDADAALVVHWGGTTQDVLDTAQVLVTRRALALVDRDLSLLVAALLELADAHGDAPLLGRTLMQPAQVISLGFKIVAWVAPLARARERLARARAAALRLQFGGAVGTLAPLGAKGQAVARRLADQLELAPADGAWHVQRDDWAALGCEVAVLCGSLGKIGHDLALLAQAEVGEVAEPSGAGRGGSSAMPQKKNPVAAMTAIAAAIRAPHHAAAVLAAMAPSHERGLGEWQAELAEWPSLFLATHGALVALADACGGLEVDSARMRANIERQHGTVFAEAAAALLVPSLGKAKAHALLASLSSRATREGAQLHALLRADPAARAIDAAALEAAFDVDAAARHAGALARVQLDRLAPSPS